MCDFLWMLDDLVHQIPIAFLEQLLCSLLGLIYEAIGCGEW